MSSGKEAGVEVEFKGKAGVEAVSEAMFPQTYTPCYLVSEILPSPPPQSQAFPC